MGVTIFRPGQRVVIPSPGMQVWSPRVASAAASGILDGISNVAAAYGLRRLKTGSMPLVRVRRSSDNAEQDISDASGEFDSAAFSAFVGGGTGYVRTWYDQSGNGRDAGQATTAAQPTIVLSAVNGFPTVRGSGSQYLLPTPWGSSLAQPFLSIATYKWTASDSYLYGGQDFSYRYNTTNATTININAGAWADSSTYTQNTWIVSSVIWSGASTKLVRNGAINKTVNGGTNAATSTTIFAVGSGSSPVNGDMAEFVVLANSLSAHNTIGADMATRFGLSWTTVT